MERLNTNGMLIDIYKDNLYRDDLTVEVFKHMGFKGSHTLMKDDEKFIKYVALMYDKNSPLKRYTIESKKEQSAKHAGLIDKSHIDRAYTLRKNNRKGEPETDLKMVGMIHSYLRSQNDFAWSSYVINAELFWQNQNTVLKGASDPKEQETIMKLMDKNETLRTRLKSYEDEIFGDNKEEMEEIIKFSVEDYVEALESIEL